MSPTLRPKTKNRLLRQVKNTVLEIVKPESMQLELGRYMSNDP
jgi:hypothetical protein